MPPILDGTAAEFGAYEPTLIDRIWRSVRPALLCLFATALICGAVALVEAGL